MASRANAGTARDDARRETLRIARTNAGRALAVAADAAAQRTLLELGTAAVEDAADFEQVANRGAVSGYASLNSDTQVPNSELATGTADTATYLRGDRTWSALVVENRTSDPGAPVGGQLWLRTDL